MVGSAQEAQKLAHQLMASRSNSQLPESIEWVFDNVVAFYADPTNPQDLLDAAESTKYPNRYLACAYWALGVECLARDSDCARQHFEEGANQGVIYLGYSAWAEAMVAVLERQQRRPPELDGE